MKSFATKFSQLVERLLPWVVLAIILLFTYVKFFAYPYAGFRWDSTGHVAYIFTEGNAAIPLQVGDRLLQADSVSWTDFAKDEQKLFIDVHPRGQVVQLRVERLGKELVIPWVMPGSNLQEVLDLLVTPGWFGFIFWVLGTLTFFKLRPKNDRWRLLLAFNYLTAVWLTVGSGLSILHLWESAFILRIFVWMCVPVYLHLHWVFPKPLGRLSPRIIVGAYLVCAIVVLAEIFQLVPQSLYYLGFLLSILGSVSLLVVHAVRQPDARIELRALINVALLSFLPTIVVSLLGVFITFDTGAKALGVVSLPLLPLAYFYAALRRQFGGVELRFNRLFSGYVFIILLLTVLLPFLILLNSWITGPLSGIEIGILIMLIAVLLTALGYRPVQIFFNRYILGVSLPPENLLELYSEHITTSASFSELKNILEAKILPHLHVNQFVFVQVESGSAHILQTLGMHAENIPTQDSFSLLGSTAGKYRPIETISANDPLAWVRLAIELKVAGELVGLWLFGRRDPEDFYTQRDIILLQSLANQTAIALSNIQQTQRVLEMYQQDIGQREQERMRLALDLHDSVLNQLAVLQMQLDDSAITPQFAKAYDELTGRLREIVHDLRPAMLNYGLKPAFDELVEGLLERDDNGLQISLDLQPDDNRYPAQMEQHLFRIVQEACENALRHGQARKISITGALLPDEINLTIADNGTGFDAGKGFELSGLLAQKHFGLAGMLERARMIGGNVSIDSSIATGTSVLFHWVQPKVTSG